MSSYKAKKNDSADLCIGILRKIAILCIMAGSGAFFGLNCLLFCKNNVVGVFNYYVEYFRTKKHRPKRKIVVATSISATLPPVFSLFFAS